MPLYEYECEACGQRFEKIQKFSDPPLDVCAKCGKGPIHKLLSSPAIQFKGSGWYITDYARKGTQGTKDGGTKESKDTTDTKDKKDAKESKESKDTASKSDSPAKTE